MPNPIITHQAPALYLKMKFPKWIDGVAICFGAFVPDLALTIEIRHVTHSLIGQLFWTVPISIILNLFFRRYVASILSNIARKNGFIPKIMRYFGVDDWEKVKYRKFDKKFFLIALYSALIGGLTHLLLDFPSHPSIELFYPWGIYPLYEVVWISGVIWTIEDITFFIASLYLLRTIKKKELIRSWYALNHENSFNHTS
jgi:hypothetical protein